MKNILLAILIITPLLFVAQNIKKEKTKSSYISYPKFAVTGVDLSTLKVDFCAGETQFGAKNVTKTSNACKATGGKATIMEVFYYKITTTTPDAYLKISDSDGNIKYIEKTAENGKGSVIFGKKKCYWAEPVLVSAYKKEQANFEAKSKKEGVASARKKAQKTLNSALFFTYVPQELEIYYPKGKNHDYSDLVNAAETATKATISASF